MTVMLIGTTIGTSRISRATRQRYWTCSALATGYAWTWGCGTGLYFDVLAGAGWTVVGLDRSADQLRIALDRSRHLVQADAAALPFADGIFSAVVTLWISTDVDDFAAVLAESARVLRPGGTRGLLLVIGGSGRVGLQLAYPAFRQLLGKDVAPLDGRGE